MLFNSAVFLWFLAGFLLFYYLVRGSLLWRNRLIVLASYVFYGWWDWRFLSLLILSSLVDYWAARAMETASPGARRRWLHLSLAVNLGALAFFKYCNFFIDNLVGVLESLGLSANLPLLEVVLPVGISFYTFQSLGYSIDVYFRRLSATRDFWAFLAYISFFPQLVAGPIERAANLLSQFTSTRTVTRGDVECGMWLILWGFFKKVVIADNLALVVDMAFGDPSLRGPVILLGTLAFGFQIYCDFSGYSDIARGLARLLGFRLMLNFNQPYLACSPGEFWRRWHISLSSWFRDYVYIPLGGNRCGPLRLRANLLLTMFLAGLWHGAGWNFILWGLWHGVLLASWRSRQRSLLRWLLTMTAVFYGWLLFRCESPGQIADLTLALWQPILPPWTASYAFFLFLLLLPILAVELWQWLGNDLMPTLKLPGFLRWSLHGILLWMILLFWKVEGTRFIYFKF